MILICDSHNCLPTDTRAVGTVTEQSGTQHLAVSFWQVSPSLLQHQLIVLRSSAALSAPDQLHMCACRWQSYNVRHLSQHPVRYWALQQLTAYRHDTMYSTTVLYIARCVVLSEDGVITAETCELLCVSCAHVLVWCTQHKLRSCSGHCLRLSSDLKVTKILCPKHFLHRNSTLCHDGCRLHEIIEMNFPMCASNFWHILYRKNVCTDGYINRHRQYVMHMWEYVMEQDQGLPFTASTLLPNT